jgi:hypothetical protein
MQGNATDRRTVGRLLGAAVPDSVTREQARARLLAEHEPKDGCWLFNTGMLKNGYARMMVNYQQDLAHRWSFRVFHSVDGAIPVGTVVRHSCDVRNCVNPGHLSLGTQSDNILECVARGRFVQNWGMRKLTPADVEYIRTSQETQVVMASKFGVARCTIADVLHGRTWSTF